MSTIIDSIGLLIYLEESTHDRSFDYIIRVLINITLISNLRDQILIEMLWFLLGHSLRNYHPFALIITILVTKSENVDINIKS